MLNTVCKMIFCGWAFNMTRQRILVTIILAMAIAINGRPSIVVEKAGPKPRPSDIFRVNHTRFNHTKTSGPEDPPRAVGFVGIGYNILYGNPEGGTVEGGGVDPGLLATRRMLKLTYNENRTTPDLKYKIPDQIDFMARMSCITTKEVDLFYGTKSYQEKLSRDIGFDIGGKGGFSFSKRYNHVEKTQETDTSVFREEYSVCNKGQAHYLTDLAGPKKFFLEDAFVSSACKLTVGYDSKQYTNFIDEWGTHVVFMVDVGNRTTIRYKEANTSFTHYVMTNRSTDISIKGGAAAGGKSLEAGFYVDMGRFKEGFNSDTKFGSKSEVYISGSAEMNEPLKVSLMGLHKVFTSDYWKQFDHYVSSGFCRNKTWIKTLSSIHDNMYQALVEYPDAKGVKNATDPEIGMPFAWPMGSYGLPKLQAPYSCPNTTDLTWETGWRKQGTGTGNYRSDPYTLEGELGRNFMFQHFCMKTYDPDGFALDWTTDGQYCVYAGSSSHECPPGLKKGFIKWRNRKHANDKDGTLPHGKYNYLFTKIHFCCATSGRTTKDIYLPADSEFVLFKFKGASSCQKVYGMSYTEEYFFWDTIHKTDGNKSKAGGEYPEVGMAGDQKIRLQYCHYVPLNSTKALLN